MKNSVDPDQLNQLVRTNAVFQKGYRILKSYRHCVLNKSKTIVSFAKRFAM